MFSTRDIEQLLPVSRDGCPHFRSKVGEFWNGLDVRRALILERAT